jgi:hypothetical protein
MSDKYYICEVNRAMCREYIELTNTSKTANNIDAINKLKEEIRQHLAFEVIAQFADEFAPEEGSDDALCSPE